MERKKKKNLKIIPKDFDCPGGKWGSSSSGMTWGLSACDPGRGAVTGVGIVLAIWFDTWGTAAPTGLTPTTPGWGAPWVCFNKGLALGLLIKFPVGTPGAGPGNFWYTFGFPTFFFFFFLIFEFI